MSVSGGQIGLFFGEETRVKARLSSRKTPKAPRLSRLRRRETIT